MKTEKKIEFLSVLRQEIRQIIKQEDPVLNRAYLKNKWFEPVFIKNALFGISLMLEKDKLTKWLARYPESDEQNKDIGIVMAGNIPLVGFHDLLSVILSGNRAVIKLSHSDDVLLPHIVNLIGHIDPRIKKSIFFASSLKKVDAVIATGSDNTARYFQHAFKNIPHLIRKNRTSCSVLDGSESVLNYEALSTDIFSYFGLGCRNVSKIFIPNGFDIKDLITHLNKYTWIKGHSKYYNNYTYQFSKNTLEKTRFIDGKFFILLKNNNLVSPIGCIYYEEYENPELLKLNINQNRNKIQCIVSACDWIDDTVAFGMAQYPEPWEYADNIDTMSFLLNM